LPGTRQYFDEVEQRKYFVELHIPALPNFLAWHGKRVLEIGCGSGTDAINFARAGADYALPGQPRPHASPLRGIRVARTAIEGNAEDLTSLVEPSAFDLVYSFGVVHHTPRPAAALAAARKVIREDGELRIMLYARHSWKAAMIEAGLDQPEAQAGCPIAFTYTADEARAMLAGARFEAVSIVQDHVFPYVIEKYVRYEYELQPWFASMPEKVFRALERCFGWHMLIKARAR
jgi:SAM-dependent methyltransferase